jgi:NADH:ubiquinone oxidoreductase subunit
MLSKLVSWWNGATIGTLWTIFKNGRFVSEDAYGNRYFEARNAKDSYDGRRRRWVTYKGYAEPTKIPPAWHAWMHYMTDTVPSADSSTPSAWAKPHHPNLTGTPEAWTPRGALSNTGQRAKAAADYAAWTPER